MALPQFNLLNPHPCYRWLTLEPHTFWPSALTVFCCKVNNSKWQNIVIFLFFCIVTEVVSTFGLHGWWESISKIFLCVFLRSKCSSGIGDEGSINSSDSGFKKRNKASEKYESFNTNLVLSELSDVVIVLGLRSSEKPQSSCTSKFRFTPLLQFLMTNRLCMLSITFILHDRLRINTWEQTVWSVTETSSTMFSLSRLQQSTFIIPYFGVFYCILLSCFHFSRLVLMHYYQTLFVPDWR